MPAQSRERRTQALILAGLLVLAALLRYRFLSGAGVSEFDPWRHLGLIDNIRKGAGFTLFDGQPYIWYNAIWYRLAAALGPAQYAAWYSSALSLAALAVFYVFLLRTEHSRVTAFAGGLLMAAYGPLITFTGGYGAESFALLLVLLACLLATYQPNRIAIGAAGLLFGLALVSRINFAFTVLLILPLLKERRNAILFMAAAGAVVLGGWWNNHSVIATHTYLFTWDGMATRSADYGLASTLVPPMQVDVARATRGLYERVAPLPFDFFSRGAAAWGNILFIVIGTACVLMTRRIGLIAATLVPLVYFGLFDATLSTHFFRHYLAVFPPLFVGIALACGRLGSAARENGRAVKRLWPVPVVAVILCGLPYLRPLPMPSLEAFAPEPEAMTQDRYMVNSGIYHPENLMYRYPGKKFIGMPLDPAQFDAFARSYPDYRTIVWHRQFSVQDELLRYLTESGRYRIAASTSSRAGIDYLILEQNGASGPPSPGSR